MSPAALLNPQLLFHRHPSSFEHLLSDKTRLSVNTPSQHHISAHRLSLLPLHHFDTNTLVPLSISTNRCSLLHNPPRPLSQGPFCALSSYTQHISSTCLLLDLSPQPSPSRRSVLTKRTRRGLLCRLLFSRLDPNAFLELILLPLVAVTAVSRPESSQPAALPRSTRDAQADLFV